MQVLSTILQHFFIVPLLYTISKAYYTMTRYLCQGVQNCGVIQIHWLYDTFDSMSIKCYNNVLEFFMSVCCVIYNDVISATWGMGGGADVTYTTVRGNICMGYK